LENKFKLGTIELNAHIKLQEIASKSSYIEYLFYNIYLFNLQMLLTAKKEADSTLLYIFIHILHILLHVYLSISFEELTFLIPCELHVLISELSHDTVLYLKNDIVYRIV
jgi:hypothetical protein